MFRITEVERKMSGLCRLRLPGTYETYELAFAKILEMRKGGYDGPLDIISET